MTVLHAEQVPAVGGDTAWTDLAAAYANLPASLQHFLDGLDAEHRFGGRAPRWAAGSESETKAKTIPIVTEHPVVRVHPVTAARVLFVNLGFTSCIVGFSPKQSDALLDLLFAEVTDSAYTVRFRWFDGVAIWDNRATAHLAPSDVNHLDITRVLYRTTIEGDVPVGVDGRESTSVSGEQFVGR